MCKQDVVKAARGAIDSTRVRLSGSQHAAATLQGVNLTDWCSNEDENLCLEKNIILFGKKRHQKAMYMADVTS